MNTTTVCPYSLQDNPAFPTAGCSVPLTARATALITTSSPQSHVDYVQFGEQLLFLSPCFLPLLQPAQALESLSHLILTKTRVGCCQLLALGEDLQQHCFFSHPQQCIISLGRQNLTEQWRSVNSVLREGMSMSRICTELPHQLQRCVSLLTLYELIRPDCSQSSSLIYHRFVYDWPPSSVRLINIYQTNPINQVYMHSIDNYSYLCNMYYSSK